MEGGEGGGGRGATFLIPGRKKFIFLGSVSVQFHVERREVEKRRAEDSMCEPTADRGHHLVKVPF